MVLSADVFMSAEFIAVISWLAHACNSSDHRNQLFWYSGFGDRCVQGLLTSLYAVGVLLARMNCGTARAISCKEVSE